MVDWKMVRMQYEVFNQQPDVLCLEYGIKPGVIEFAIEEEGWRRLPVSNLVKDWDEIKEMDELTDEVIDDAKSRLSLLTLVKQATLSTRYIALESAILHKAYDFVQTLGTEHPGAAKQLKEVTEVLGKLQDRNALLYGRNTEDGEEQQKVVVQIMNKISHTAEGTSGKQGASVVDIGSPQQKVGQR